MSMEEGGVGAWREQTAEGESLGLEVSGEERGDSWEVCWEGGPEGGAVEGFGLGGC